MAKEKFCTTDHSGECDWLIMPLCPVNLNIIWLSYENLKHNALAQYNPQHGRVLPMHD